MIVLLFICIAFVSACVILCLKKLRLSQATHNISVMPDGLPIIGHVHKLKTLWTVILKNSRSTDETGGISKMWMGTKYYIVLTDPAMAYKILNSCLAKNDIYKFTDSWIGGGLFTADVPVWKRHRKLLNPTFNHHAYERFLEIFNKQSAKLIVKLMEKVGTGSFDVDLYLKRNSLETICLTAFDESDIGLSKDYEAAAHEIMKLYVNRFKNAWFHIDMFYAWSNLKKREDRLVATLKDLPFKVLQKKRLAMESPGYDKSFSEDTVKTFMDLLLEIGNTGKMTDEEIRSEVDSMIIGGFDTTSTAMLSILCVLKLHPDVQEKAYEEIMRVVGQDSDVLQKHLSELVYVESIIKETLRLYPIVPAIAREVERDVKLGKYTFPSGSSAFINIYGMHRHARWGPEPTKFRPERWLDPASLPDERCYAAFSLGRRGCIGKHYGMLFMKTTLVHLLRKYKITGAHEKLKLSVGVLMKFCSGHLISLELRKLRQVSV